MPEERYDLVDGLNNRIEALEDKLNESIEKNIELSKVLSRLKPKQSTSLHLVTFLPLMKKSLEKWQKIDFDNC